MATTPFTSTAPSVIIRDNRDRLIARSGTFRAKALSRRGGGFSPMVKRTSVMADQSEVPANPPEPANLRFLRRLVTTLTATMILGLIAIFTVLVIRLQTTSTMFPEITALPAGTEVLSVSRTPRELVIIDLSRRIYVLSLDGTTLLQEFELK
jgi:hypothetical protein